MEDVWPRALLDRLGVEHPILQAPMAGGITTPELVAAVSEAGGLGSLGGGYLAPEALRAAIRAVRALTARPFGVNLFVPEPARAAPSEDEVERAAAALEPFRAEVGLSGRPAPSPPPPFEAQLRIVLDEAVPAFSFTFGALPAAEVAALAGRGACVMGTATTAREARLLEAAGVHAVIAQGAEAGGHRGTFDGPPERALAGTLALVPLVVDAVSVPVVAAGGIMDGRGIAAALCLGASGVQMGTAFVACPESGAQRPYREAILSRAGEGDATVLTRAFSGRLARGLANRFTEGMAAAPVLPYPFQNALTVELRQAAARAGRPDLLSLWAGQAHPLARALPAGALVRTLVAEARTVLARLGATAGAAPAPRG
jgi:nitronate monooxygenase